MSADRPRHVRLTPAELGNAAGLAGGVPLPFTAPADDGEARSSLGRRGLVGPGGVLPPPLAAALVTLAVAPVSVVLDVAVRRGSDPLRVRSWHAAGPGLVARLSLVGADTVEVGWAGPRWWVAEAARLVRVSPQEPPSLPPAAALPVPLLLAAVGAHRRGRDDLVPVLARSGAGHVRWGAGSGARTATMAETRVLLDAVTTGCRGRARVLATDRGPRPRPGVASWLLLDDTWHELSPGRAGRCVLRRVPAERVGLVTWPRVATVVGEAA